MHSDNTLKSTSVSVCFRGISRISLLSSFCDDSNLHISLFKYVLSTMGVSKESISKKFADRFLACTHRGKYILAFR